MESSPDADLGVKALDHAWEHRGQPEKVMFHLDRDIGIPAISSVALLNETKHEPARQLLGQRPDGKTVPEPEV